MKPAAQWYRYAGITPEGKTVHERNPRTTPLLYAADGRPLFEAKPPVGFKPPKGGAA